MSQNNKIAIVTGASTGLGKSISIKLALKGYKIILASRNEKKLNEVHDIIDEGGGQSQVIVTDVSNETDIEILYSKIDIERVDIVVNKAGFGVFNKINKISSDEWDKQMNTNLRGSFLISRYIAESMIKRKTGRLIYINSVAGINAYPFSSAYVASKFGLRGFTSSLREELREHNIKVISIHPGAVDTPFWKNVNVDFPKDEMLKSDDVAESVVHAILAPNNVVQEEVVIRRTGGDFK